MVCTSPGTNSVPGTSTLNVEIFKTNAPPRSRDNDDRLKLPEDIVHSNASLKDLMLLSLLLLRTINIYTMLFSVVKWRYLRSKNVFLIKIVDENYRVLEWRVFEAIVRGNEQS